MPIERKKAIIIGVSVLIAGLIIWSIYLLIPRAHVVLQIAPKDASLKVGEKNYGEVVRGQKISISPGTHSFELSRDEFSTENVTVEVKDGETKEVMIALTPQTAEAWEILRSDDDSVAIFEGYNSKKGYQNIVAIEAENPLYKQLPVDTREYYIGVCDSLKHPKDELKKAVCVDLTVDHPSVRDMARTALQKIGFDFSKEEIYYSADANKYNVISTDAYTIDHYHDLSGVETPTFAIMVNFKEMASTAAYEDYLIQTKDQALAKLAADGYKIENLNIVYVNPQLEQFNTNEDVEFPSVAH